MRLGLMQPYFVPALGYFDLIALCDRWVVFDTAQFRGRSWMTRNRILHPQQGWSYLGAHVAQHRRDTPIHAISLVSDSDWRDHAIRQLAHYRRAPGYDVVVDLLRGAFAAEPASLARLSVELLRRVCELLGIRFVPQYLSELGLELGPIEQPGDWALRVGQALGATEYINPPGGAALYDPARFAAAGIRLHIRRFHELAYQPEGFEYIPTLSIVDVLMWNDRGRIQAHLDAERTAFEASARLAP